MQFESFFLVCATLACVAESRLFGSRILPPRTRFQQRTAAPTPSMPFKFENTGPVKPLPTDMPSIPEDNAERDWPYAMMEFSSLVGRCTTAQFMWKMMRNKPSEGILVESCPHVYEAAKLYAEADEEARARAEDFSEEVFHLLQCMNLQAERENLEALTARPAPFKTPRGSKPDNMYFKEAGELFEMCERVFDDAEKYLQNWASNFGNDMTNYESSVKGFLRRAYPKIAKRYPHRG